MIRKSSVLCAVLSDPCTHKHTHVNFLLMFYVWLFVIFFFVCCCLLVYDFLFVLFFRFYLLCLDSLTFQCICVSSLGLLLISYGNVIKRRTRFSKNKNETKKNYLHGERWPHKIYIIKRNENVFMWWNNNINYIGAPFLFILMHIKFFPPPTSNRNVRQ